MTSARSAFGVRDTLLLCLLAMMWGNSFLLIKIAVSAVSPLWIVALRMTIGGALLLGIGAWLRRKLPRDGAAHGALAFIGIVGGALPWVGQEWAQQFLDSGLLAVLNSCTPIATLLFAVMAGQEKLYRNRVIGLAIAITGTLIVIRGEVGSGKSGLALLVAVLATAGYAIGGVVTRARISGRVPTTPAAAIQLCWGALALAPVAWGVSGPVPTSLSPSVIGALLGLGLLSTGIAFIIYFTLIESVGATNASMVTYIVPVVGLASGTVFRGERFGANVFAGAVALIGGVWLAQRRPAALVASVPVR
jgi:drug/metabolite transporter (DMT)-like permease